MKSILAVAVFVQATLGFGSSRIIGGEVTSSSEYPEVVQLATQLGNCAGVIVGPEVVLTAAHCVKDGEKSFFNYGGKTYRAEMHRSLFYPKADNDLAVGIVYGLRDAKPARIAKGEIGQILTLVGYGGPGNSSDSPIPRQGKAAVIEMHQEDLVTLGAAIYFGDSGAPAFLDLKTRSIVAIGSKGDLEKKSFLTDLSSEKSKDFLGKMASKYEVEICGVNADCAE